jgi:hypothetical protein
LTAASLLNESYVKAVVAMEPYLSGRLGVRNFLFANACPVGRAEAYREGVATAAVAAAAAVQQAASAAGADLTGAPPPVLAGKEEEVHRGPFHRFLNKVQAIALRACASGGGSVVAVVRALRLAGAALLDLFLAYTGSGRAVYIPLVLSDVQLSTPSLCAPKHPHHQQQQDNTPPAAAPGSSVPDAVHHEWPWHSWANPLCYPVSLGRLPHNDAMAMFEAASHSVSVARLEQQQQQQHNQVGCVGAAAIQVYAAYGCCGAVETWACCSLLLCPVVRVGCSLPGVMPCLHACLPLSPGKHHSSHANQAPPAYDQTPCILLLCPQSCSD